MNFRRPVHGRRVGRSLPTLGVVAAASVVAAQLTPMVAHAGGPSTSAGDPGVSSTRGTGPDERTTLETCTGYYGGAKVPMESVGFFHDIATNDGSFNRIKSGGRRELEFRVLDLDQNCVIGDTEVINGYANEVSCADPSSVIQYGAGTFSIPEFEEDEQHFEQYWTAPKGKNRCYVVSVNSLTALFRSK